MKHKVKMGMIGLLLAVMCSCESEMQEQYTYVGMQPVEVQEDSIITLPCSFDSRNTIGQIKEEKGVITRFSPEDETYFITPTNPDLPRLSPCNLPAEFQQDGLQVTFSGEIKEVYPNERWAAQPFKLHKIN